MEPIKSTLNETTLIPFLSKNLNLNLSRTKCAAAMVNALTEGRNVNLARIASLYNSQAQISSRYKQLQRFMKEVNFSPSQLAKTFLDIMEIDPEKDKLCLILDRTNWKFGKQHCNILYLAAAHQGTAIPLFYTILEDKKNGNSDFSDRIALLQQFIDTFGKESIKCLLGDREFIGKNWIQWLKENNIPYAVRIREKGQYMSTSRGKMVKAATLFRSLKANTSTYLGERKIGKTNPYVGHVTGIKTSTGEIVLLLHSADIDQACQLYRERWQIELLFKVMKSSGFNLEATHITNPARLTTLLGIVAISACFAYRIGSLYIEHNPPRIKKHGYKPFNTIRSGLDFITDWIRGNFLDNNSTYYKKLVPLLASINLYFSRLKIFVL